MKRVQPARVEKKDNNEDEGRVKRKNIQERGKGGVRRTGRRGNDE